MTWLEYLERDCQVLSARLKRRNVPKSDRAAARRALSRVFALLSSERSDVEEAELRGLARRVEAWAYPLDPEWVPGFVVRSVSYTPVRLRFAVSHSRIRDLHDRYLSRAERLEEIVDWFWQRCEPDGEVARERTIQEKAMEEFAGEDLEFVWGRRKRPQM